MLFLLTAIVQRQENEKHMTSIFFKPILSTLFVTYYYKYICIIKIKLNNYTLTIKQFKLFSNRRDFEKPNRCLYSIL